MTRRIVPLGMAIVLGLLHLVVAQPATAPQPQQAVTPHQGTIPQFATGWLVHVYPAPHTVEQLPQDALGGFIDTTGAPYTFDLYKQQPGLKWYQGNPAYGFEGWLEAQEAGRHTVIFEITIPPFDIRQLSRYTNYPRSPPVCRCRVVFHVEDETFVDELVVATYNQHRNEAIQQVLVSGHDFVTGFYRLKAWVVCVAQLFNEKNRSSAVQMGFDTGKVVLNVRLKRPSSAMALPITTADMLHQVKTTRTQK